MGKLGEGKDKVGSESVELRDGGHGWGSEALMHNDGRWLAALRK